MRSLLISVTFATLAACATVPHAPPRAAAQAAPANATLRPTKPARTPARAGAAPQAKALGACLAEKRPTVYLDCYVLASHEQLRVLGIDAKSVRLVMCLSCMESYVANEECQNAHIDGDYPLWVFPDGTRLKGLQSRKAIAKAAGCANAN